MIKIHANAIAAEVEHEFTNHLFNGVATKIEFHLPFYVFIAEIGEAIRECYRAIEATEFTEISKTEAIAALDRSVEKVYNLYK